MKTFKYKNKLQSLLNEDYALLTKLYLLYELENIVDVELDDNKIDELYQQYLDDYRVNNINEFITNVVDAESEV